MKFILLVLLIVLTSGAGLAQAKRSPALRVRDLNRRSLSLADYKGNVVLVNFWATWCIPCRTEIPDLIKLQQRYRKAGLRVIGITYPPQKLSTVRHFARALHINYRLALGTKATKKLFSASETLPLTIVIDRDGVVRDVIEGIMYPDEFDQKVKPLLMRRTVSYSSFFFIGSGK